MIQMQDGSRVTVIAPLQVPVHDLTSEAALMAHINDPDPHPAYDDIPSLVLLFENGLI